MVQLVDNLFVTHRGRYIDSFQIYINPVGVENFLHKWLEICREKRIQELDLFFLEPGYTLTADFVNQLNKLSFLKLVHCNLELPLNLLSMANLRSLILRFVPLTDERIHALISHCRQLETVDLLYCTGLLCVEIYAREHRFFKKLRVAGCKNLEVFVVDSPVVECVHYYGHVPTRIRFIQTTKLNEVYLNFMPAGSRGYLQASVVEKLVSDIPNVKVLSASALVPEALTAKFRRGVFGEASYSFLNLMELHLIMEGGLFCNPYDILAFMKHCPLLEKLFIDIDDYTFDCGPYWELHQKSKMENFDLCFDRLNFIKLRGFKFITAELQLVKILLQKATHLDALVLVSQKNCVANVWTPYGRRYDKLLHSWKASPEAKIVTFEHLDDQSRSSSSSHSRDCVLSID
ncbi:putative FBD-associated F-box protein At1g61330 isoform X2 [Vigna unguiculata]|nr:putative FBD-associated F-box protein At1g61330 isoform X2 [Vigna unguiculata]